MLKNIDPILTPPLLSILKEMGHGDEIVIVDTNFPAHSVGQRVVHMPGLDAPRVLEAVLSLMRLDYFVDSRAATLRPIDPKDASAIFDLFQRACDKAEARPVRIEPVDRFAFYERAAKAYAVIQSGERRLYGNIILKKGIVRPDA
jgi:L-fucose mutarotase